MKTLRVAIGASSFAAEDDRPLVTLRESGIDVIPNPYGRRLTEDEVITHLQNANGVIAGLEPLTRKVFETTPDLKAIARVGIGMDNIDLVAAKDFSISVSNTPDAPTNSVAEMCLASLLAISRRINEYNRDMHDGVWTKQIGIGLKGLNILIIGYGRIGRKFSDFLRVLGANIYVYDPFIDDSRITKEYSPVSLTEGLGLADVISLHASGNEVILDQNSFDSVKNGAILLNSARAELVDESALTASLNKGTIKFAWFDTFWHEPYSGSLINYDQVLLTPHVSTYTRQCRSDMELSAVHNLLRDLKVTENM